MKLLLLIPLLLAGCATRWQDRPADGPDTPQTFDAAGRPNFGPAPEKGVR